jgi:hypothetical protein
MFGTSLKTMTAAVLCMTAAAFAGPWSTPSGSTSNFDYQSGGDLNGHFGNPVVSSLGFDFVPPSLEANVANNNHLEVGDTVGVVLQAKPDQMFTRVTANMFGDLAGLGCTSFNGQGQLRVTNLDTSFVLWSNLNFDTLPIEDNDAIATNWLGQTLLVLPSGWSNIKIDLDGMVGAYADNSSTAFIESKGATIGVETAAVPLPPALLAAIPAAFIAYRARRRSVRA